MAYGSSVVKILLFLTVSVALSSADTHTLQLFCTGITGLNFPEFTSVLLMNGEQFVYYDSDIKEAIPKTEWVQKLKSDEPIYWDFITERMWAQEEWFKVSVATAMQSFNQSKGIHIWQQMYGCELDDDGTTRGYIEYGCDGEDFISLDLKAVSWSAAKPQATITESKWKSTEQQAKHCKDFLRFECVNRLRKFESYSRKTLKKKVGPVVSILQKHSSPSPEVVCQATGFFPSGVMITWQKDGEDVHEDVDLRETLPNQDGSFQKRSILKVPAEELQKHTYTCVVQHSSLEKELVREVPKGEGSGGGPDGAPASYIIGIVTAVLVLVVAVVGIVFWKKKSGFKPVSQSSVNPWEGDSSSTNS